MKIIVCIKQVPDTTEIKWTENNTIQRDGVESIMNPCDVYALEEALKLRPADITAITMGPSQADSMLRKAIAVGCDRGILLSDKKFAGSDTYATGKTLAAAIKNKLPDFDLIICGQFAIDGDTAQTGPEIATRLGIPQVTFVRNILKKEENCIYAQREIEEGVEIVKVELPALICVMQGYEEPSRPTINGIKKAQNAMVEILGIDDIGLTPEETGIKGSPTYVSRAFRPQHNRGECDMCTDCVQLAEKIKLYGGFNG